MLRVLVPNDAGDLVVADVPPGFVPTDSWAWFDVEYETDTEVKQLGRRLGLSHHGIEDACVDVHLPKLDDYGDQLFMVLHGVTEVDGRLATSELDAFLGRNYLVTVRRGASPSIDWVVENGARRADGPDVVLARIAEASARRILPLIEALDEESIKLEERSLDGHGEVVAEIQALRRDTIQLRRHAVPQRDVITLLASSGSDLVGTRARQRFASARDHHVRAVEALDSGRALLTSALESYRGAVAEKMNEVMKVLTVYAAILLPLSLLAGIYGMNFSNMPELQWRWGHFGLLGLMAVVAIAQWIYFARRGFVGKFPIKRIPTTVGRGLVRLARLPLDAAGLMMGAHPEDGPDDADEDGAGII